MRNIIVIYQGLLNLRRLKIYAKLFASLYQGTLRGQTDEILVFTNLLAHCDSTGCVDKHPKAISEETGLSISRVQDALFFLESPDPESRSPEEEGRRIIRLDEHRSWGWRIVNHGKYRSIRSEEDRREQNRLAQERWRNKNKQSKPRKPESAYTEAEAEAYKELLSGKPDDLPGFTSFWTAWPRSERKQGKAKCRVIWKRLRLEDKAAEIVAHVQKMAKSEGWLTGFDPLPLTYLNGQRWDGAELGAPVSALGECEWNKNGNRDPHSGKCQMPAITRKNDVFYCRDHANRVQ